MNAVPGWRGNRHSDPRRGASLKGSRPASPAALTDVFDGFLHHKRFIILDRDRKFCEAFRALLESDGTTPLRLPPRSPNLNAYAERDVRSIKEECLERMIFFGEASLHRALREYVVHYHRDRLIAPEDYVGQRSGRVQCRERLGGMLRYYHRQAA